MRVGFIGLGNVGGKLAGSLLRHGYDLMVHDIERDAAATLLSALDDRDPTVIRAAMVSYADRVQGVRLQAKAYDLVARQHVQSALFAAPQLGPCASSGRAWQHGAPNRCLGCWS